MRKRSLQKKPKKVKPVRLCKCCDKILEVKQKNYCSQECSHKAVEKFDWNSVDLVDLVDVQGRSFLSLEKVFNTSDNTIRKHYLRQKNKIVV